MQTIPKPVNSKGELAQLLSRYLPYWPYFLVSVLICTGLAKLYLHYKTPVYQITASILIKNNEPGQSNNNSFLSPIDVFSSKKVVENETAILESHTLMDEVVRKLGLYAPIYLDATIHHPSGYIESPVRLEAEFPDKIKAPADIQKIYFTYDGTQVNANGQNFPLNRWVNSPWGEIRFVPNPEYVITPHKKNYPLFFVLLSVNQVAEGLINNLSVTPASKLSTVIDLSLRDQVPQRGKDVLNTLIDFYNASAIEDKNKLAANAVSFLDQRLRYVSSGLDSIEMALQLYKANRGGVDLSEQSKLILGSVSSNDEKLNEINIQLATLQQIKSYVEGNGGNPGIIPSSGNGNDNILSAYLGNLYDAELQYDRLRKTTAENNPLLLSLKDQIDKIKPTILQYVNNKISGLEIAKNSLSTTAGQYSSALRTIPEKQRELLEISRQQNIKSDLYDFLLKRREEAALAYAATVSDTRVVDHAVVAPGPVSPKKQVILGIALILGLLIPAVLLRFNAKVISKDEITDILNYPMLGEISRSTNKKGPIVASDRRDVIAEQFRQVRTCMASALGINQLKNKIMITSALPGEGKSFIASNLAVNLALSGKKVLLIDMDLHKPGVGKIFNLQEAAGLTDFLLDQSSMDEIVYATDISENLFIVPSGKDNTEPSELILTGKLPGLLTYLEGMYDYILIDVAPVNIITDGYAVSRLCDATLLVVCYKITPKSELWSLRENPASRELKNTGIILNGVRSLISKHYGKQYYGYVGRRKKKDAVSV